MSAGMIALNRFGLGARPGEIDRLSDPRQWLLEQIGTEPPGLVNRTPTPLEIAEIYAEFIAASRSREQADRQAAVRRMGLMRANEVDNLITTRIQTDRPFMERWVAFWSNHLCVSSSGGPEMIGILGAYEREAIRPHALGSFEEMLLASARHPGMLRYLDNQQSAGPNSDAIRGGGRRRRNRQTRRRSGLNENYARELLELHTVGVDGGYTLEDIQELARILTGWSIDWGETPGEQPLGFRFEEIFHEPGSKTVLGRRYIESGEREGIRVIRDLARLPQTSRFISTKIAQHFIADDPPASGVDRLAEVWLETNGNLRSIAEALVNLDEAWGEEHRKFRTPQDWIVAVFRATGQNEVDRRVMDILRALRHEVWAPQAPTGYSDTTGDWADPDSLMNRAELARTFVDRVPRMRRFDPSALLQVTDIAEDDPLRDLLTGRAISANDRLALAIASPSFQWR